MAWQAAGTQYHTAYRPLVEAKLVWTDCRPRAFEVPHTHLPPAPAGKVPRTLRPPSPVGQVLCVPRPPFPAEQVTHVLQPTAQTGQVPHILQPLAWGELMSEPVVDVEVAH